MISRGKSILISFLQITALVLSPMSSMAAYLATELLKMPEGSVSKIRGVDNNGEVIGGAWSSGRHKGFLLQDETKQNLDGKIGSDYSTANGINDKGQIIGSTNTPVGTRATRSQKNGVELVELGTLPGDRNSSANAINQLGEVVGTSGGKNGIRSVIWKNTGEIKQLSGLYGSLTSSALANNDLGDVVGISEIYPGPRGVLWRNDQVLDLGALPGDKTSEALAINNKGEIVGSSGNPNKVTRAVLWSTNKNKIKIVDLGLLSGGSSSRALGINNLSEVVGTSDSYQGNRAFLWKPESGMLDLNDQLTTRSGFVLTQAVAINSKGLIIAVGIDEMNQGEKHQHDAQVRIFQLTPLP